MRKSIKVLLTGLVACALCCALSMPCFAASTVTYSGNSGEFIFASGNDKNPTDLFADFKDLMPGDTLTQEIVVKNSADKEVNVEVFLKSLGADKESEEFLKKLSLSVKVVDGDVLSSGNASEAAGLTEYTSLGKIASGGEAKLQVTISLPKELSDDYQDALGKVTWQFMVEEKPVEKPVPTADNSAILLCGSILVLSLAIGGALIALRRKNRV